MAKSAERKTNEAVTKAAARSTKSLTDGRAKVTDRDIARRAYDLYLVRGRAQGHDVEDWLQAERELRRSLTGKRSKKVS